MYSTDKIIDWNFPFQPSFLKEREMTLKQKNTVELKIMDQFGIQIVRSSNGSKLE